MSASCRSIPSPIRGCVAAAMLCGAATAEQAEARGVILENASGVAIVRLYATPASEADWHEDVLGAVPVADGESRELEVGDGCLFDFKVLYADGNQAVLRDVDVCQDPVLRP
jgi:hypothetical protein